MADLDGQAGEELIGGTASQDLYALGADGRPLSRAWPKLTSDWMVANPLIGSFGGSERKVVVAIARSGTLLAYRTAAPACSPSSWPRFHHDEANSGDFAPGDDLLCGRPQAYEVATDGRRAGQ